MSFITEENDFQTLSHITLRSSLKYRELYFNLDVPNKLKRCNFFNEDNKKSVIFKTKVAKFSDKFNEKRFAFLF